MLKSFNDLYNLDLTGHTKGKPKFKKQGNTFVPTGEEFSYLSWSNCLVLLHENGAESVHYGAELNSGGHTLFLLEGKLPEVHVWVEIDGETYKLVYPVIDGSKDIKMESIVQSDVHYAVQRAFVKCVAINTGLGLKLWSEDPDATDVDDLELHNILKIKERIERTVTQKIASGTGFDDVLRELAINKKQWETLMSFFQKIQNLEFAVNRL